MLRVWCGVLLLLLFMNPLAARDAHVHGEAALAVAVDDGVLHIAFHTPMANLVGFEHESRDARQARAIQTAAATLRAADRVFQLDAAAACTLTAVRVELAYADQLPASAAHDPSAGEHHRHHDHDHDHAEAAGHSDGFADYRFACGDARRLNTLRVRLQRHFPGLHALKAVWVTAGGQGSKTLRAGDDTIVLR